MNIDCSVSSERSICCKMDEQWSGGERQISGELPNMRRIVILTEVHEVQQSLSQSNLNIFTHTSCVPAAVEPWVRRSLPHIHSGQKWDDNRSAKPARSIVHGADYNKTTKWSKRAAEGAVLFQETIKIAQCL